MVDYWLCKHHYLCARSRHTSGLPWRPVSGPRPLLRYVAAYHVPNLQCACPRVLPGHVAPESQGFWQSHQSVDFVSGRRSQFRPRPTPRWVRDETMRTSLRRLGVSWKGAKHWITSPDTSYTLKNPMRLADSARNSSADVGAAIWGRDLLEPAGPARTDSLGRGKGEDQVGRDGPPQGRP